MEKSNQSSFLKSLALAFGDGLAFGVAVKLAQGHTKTREDGMTDLGPLAERLRKVEDRVEHTQTIDREALSKFGEGLDGRVLEKVIVALEARLTEHVGQVDRRLAEIDAQVALDLKAVDTHTAAQTSAVERALQQIEAQVRDYVASAQQAGAAQIAGVDQRLSALQETLPAKFREIIEAVRQSMEARVALELTEMEGRVKSGAVAPEQLQEFEAKFRGEVEALSGKLMTELQGLAEQQQTQTAPLQHALQQLETKLSTLREELPPKIRQIVEAVEASMEARIAAGDEQAAGRLAALEQALGALRDEMPSAGGFRQAIDESLQRHAEQVGALDRKLTVLQEELPPKIKAIVDALRESLDARVAAELQTIDERHGAQIQQAEARLSTAHEQLRQELTAAAKTPVLEQNVAAVQADLAVVHSRLDQGDRRAAEQAAGVEQHVAQLTAGMSSQLESLLMRQQSAIEQLEERLRAERQAETQWQSQNVPAQINSAVDGLRLSLEARLASEIRSLEARSKDHSPELEKALQYASLLESRVVVLEQKLASSAEEVADRAVERVWQALETRLQQRAPAPVAQPVETISDLRQRSTSAERNVLDLIAGIGHLFEKSAPPAVRETPPPEAQPEAPAAAAAGPEAVEPAAQPVAEAAPQSEAEAAAPPDDLEPPPPASPELAEPAPVAAAPAPPAEPEAEAQTPPEAGVIRMPEPKAAEPAAMEDATEAGDQESEAGEEPVEGKSPVILFKPKEAGRKWRIPFVSSFLLMTAAFAWLQLM